MNSTAGYTCCSTLSNRFLLRNRVKLIRKLLRFHEIVNSTMISFLANFIFETQIDCLFRSYYFFFFFKKYHRDTGTHLNANQREWHVLKWLTIRTEIAGYENLRESYVRWLWIVFTNYLVVYYINMNFLLRIYR